MLQHLLLGASQPVSSGGSGTGYGGTGYLVAGTNDSYWEVLDGLGAGYFESKGIKKDSAGNLVHLYANGDKAFIFSTSPLGTVLWQREITFNTNHNIRAFCIDSNNDIIMCGQLYTSVSPITGGHYLSKFNVSTNSFTWKYFFDQQASYAYTAFYDVDVDSVGNIYAVGNTRVTNNYQNALIAVFNSSGALQNCMSHNPGSNSYYAYTKIKVISSTEAIIIGDMGLSVIGKINLNPASGGAYLMPIWMNSVSPAFSAQNQLDCFDIDAAGNIYVAGAFVNSPNSFDQIVFKFNSSGAIQWYNMASRSQYYYTSDIAVDAIGNSYTTNDLMLSTGDVREITKRNASGFFQWTRRFEISGASYTGTDIDLRRILVDGNNLYLNGGFDVSATSNNTTPIILRLATDGTNTGIHGAFTYSVTTPSTPTPGWSTANFASNIVGMGFGDPTTGLDGTFTNLTATVNPSTTAIQLDEQLVLGTISAATPTRVSGTGAPFKSSSSTGGASAGWTTLQSISRDDGFVTVPLGFNWNINNINYSSVYVGSNNYITFRAGRTQYSSYDWNTWGDEKILLAKTSDNSYQYVTYKQFTGYTRIRFEGNSSTSGTVGAGNIVWEATFFDPSTVGNIPIVEFRFGNNGRSGYTMGIAGPSNTVPYTSHGGFYDNSVVYEGNASGTAFTSYVGSHMTNYVGL